LILKTAGSPDLAELRSQIENNPSVCAIMIINPDNPTGMVYSQETLQQIVAIAKEFGLFIISDEVYNNIVYNGKKPYRSAT
jgi:alanine-synthesizing transaminase